MRKTFLAIAIIVMALAPLAAQSVTVVSPNGGEQWVLDAPQNITWTSTNAGSLRVNIVLRNSGGLVGVIKSQVLLSAGSWTWTVGKLENGTTVPAGSNYIVRIRDAGNTFSDDSSNPFSIITAAPPPPPPPGGPASITVASPNGGESWPSGSTKNILWTAANWSGTVQLNLWQNGAFKGTIATGVPSSPGSYPWPVGKLVSGSTGIAHDYKVRVIREYKGGPRTPVPLNPLMDESDGPFSIAVPRLEASETAATIKMIKPEDGSVFSYPAPSGVLLPVAWETKYMGPLQVILCNGNGKQIRKLMDIPKLAKNSENYIYGYSIYMKPQDSPPGWYRVKVQTADGMTSGISGKFRLAYKVALGSKPDLIVCKIFPARLPDKPAIEGWLLLRVYNIGTARSQPCWLRMAIQGSIEGEYQVGKINPGAYETVEFKKYKFSGTGPRLYTFHVDFKGEVVESNENNNILDGSISRVQSEPTKCSDGGTY